MYSFNYEQFGAMMVLVIPALAAGIAVIIKSLKGVKDSVQAATAIAKDASLAATADRSATSDTITDGIAVLGQRLDNRFAGINGRLEAINRRLDDHGNQMAKLTKKMDEHIKETSAEKVS